MEKLQRPGIPEITTMVLFVVSSLFAILLALMLAGQNSSYSNTSPTAGIGTVIIYIVFAIGASFAILFLARRRRLRFMRIIFLFLILYIVFYVVSIVGVYLVNTYFQYYLLIFGVTAVYGYFLIFRNSWIITNLSGFFLSAGVSAVWGTLIGVWAAVLFLIAFAVYDYISVYKTKHMVSLAEVAVNESLPMLFVVPTQRGVKMSDVKIGQEDGERKAIMLGFGDVALPSILVVSSAMFGRAHLFWFAVLPVLGGIIGMLFLFSDFVKKPAPGLPMINSGVILGFLAAYLAFVGI